MKVQLFSGSLITPGQTPLVVNTVNVVGEAWSATFAGLGPGSYTVRAEQSDDVGNLGVSNTATFTVGPERRCDRTAADSSGRIVRVLPERSTYR